MLEIQGAAYSDIGLVRQKNEDNFYCQGYFRRGYQLASTYSKSFRSSGDVQVYAVSDGMGGMAKGEIASRIAVSELGAFERELSNHKEIPATEAVASYLNERNEQIVARNRMAGSENEGMGATISILIFAEGKAVLANMGDSAVFHCRHGQLKQISRDDSHAARLRSLGYLTSDEAKTHPMRNSLTNYLGRETNGENLGYFLVPDIQIENHDLFLLCSDGISGFLGREAIRNVLAEEATVEAKAEELVNLAEAAGSSDNITLILLEVIQQPGLSFVANTLIEGEDLDRYQSEEDLSRLVNDETRVVPTSSLRQEQTSRLRQEQTPPPVKRVRTEKEAPLALYPIDSNQEAVKQPQPKPKAKPRQGEAEVSPEQMANYEKMRLEAFERQQVRKEEQAMKRNEIPSEQTPVSGNYSKPAAQPITREQKQQIYDKRYSDGTTEPVITQMDRSGRPQPAGASEPVRARKKRGGLRRFLSWFVFLLLFVALGYGLVWLIVNGASFLPF